MSLIIKIDDMVLYQSLENKSWNGDVEADGLINLLPCKIYNHDELILEGTFCDCTNFLNKQLEEQIFTKNLS